jgi:DNA polymerase-1
MEENKKKIIVFDSNAVIHRAYHALPRLTAKDGRLVNAVYGFFSVFLKAVSDFSPSFIAAVFDLPAPTFRHKKYKEYKAKRPKAPDDLYSQIPIIKEVLAGFNVKIFEKSGFEADDVIGTIVTTVAKEKLSTASAIIISGDLDSLQLVNKNTGVYFLRRGVKDTVLYDEKMVAERLGGLTPGQITDYKSLRGDPSDNIPGVKGIGEKTAIKLILDFGSLENIYQELEKKSERVKNLAVKLKENLIENKSQAFFSKELVELEKNVPIDFVLADCKWSGFDREKITKVFSGLGFDSLLKRIDNAIAKEKVGKQGKLL